MSEEYEGYYLSFQERFPRLHALGTGMVIGGLSAIAVSSSIALSQFASGAPWKELLALWGKMIVLTIPAFVAAFGAGFLAHHYRRNLEPTLEDFRLPVTTTMAVVHPQCTMEVGPPMLLAEAVAQNAQEQASRHYERNIEPTRDSFQKMGVSQTIWNSGRHILTTAKIIVDGKWAPTTWIRVSAVLNRVHAEENKVWVPILGERGMICLHIGRATNKRYTHPTPPAWEPEYNQEQPGSAGSGN